MSYRFIYEPKALVEYKEAIIWYLDRSESAADLFVKGIREKITVICDDPFRYWNTYKEVRETSMKEFPYCIVYFVDESRKLIIILSVYHYKRNPRRKYKK